MREPSTPCTLEHPTGSDRRTSTFAEPLARRSDAQNPLSATARLRSRLLIARAVPRIPQEPHTDHHTRPKNNACEKCGLGLQIAVQLFGKLFHLFQFFVEVFGQKALAQLLQIGVQRHTQRG